MSWIRTWLTVPQGCDKVWVQFRMKAGAKLKALTDHGDIDSLFITTHLQSLCLLPVYLSFTISTCRFWSFALLRI